MNKKYLYFCTGCKQVHYDEDFDPIEGDLEIDDWDKFLKSVELIKSVKGDKGVQK